MRIYIAEGGELAVGVALSIGYQVGGVDGFCHIKCMIFQVVAVHLWDLYYFRAKASKIQYFIHPDSP